jgi:hypothetical protein
MLVGFAVTGCGGVINMDLEDADQLREVDSQNHPGRWRSNPAADGTVRAISAEVLRRLAVTDEVGRVIVREACEDAAAGQRPRC